MRAANAKIQPRRRLLARSVRVAGVIVVSIVVCLPLVAHAQPPAASGALAKNLQDDLQSLATLARSQGDTPSIGRPAIEAALALLDRIRVADLLLEEQQRGLETWPQSGRLACPTPPATTSRLPARPRPTRRSLSSTT